MTRRRLSEALRAQIRAEAGDRCGYCLVRQAYVPWPLEIEHIIPLAKGGTDDPNNLWLAYHTCNLHKSDQTHARDPWTGRLVHLFNPRQQRWGRHFGWSEDGALILGRSACGRATVIALSLNNLLSVTVRRNWIAAGWHPPRE